MYVAIFFLGLCSAAAQECTGEQLQQITKATMAISSISILKDTHDCKELTSNSAGMPSGMCKIDSCVRVYTARANAAPTFPICEYMGFSARKVIDEGIQSWERVCGTINGGNGQTGGNENIDDGNETSDSTLMFSSYSLMIILLSAWIML